MSRITGDAVREWIGRDIRCGERIVTVPTLNRLADQLDADAAAVAEMAAIERVRGHERRDKDGSFGWDRGAGHAYCTALLTDESRQFRAPTMAALADKLDALRPVPEPEVWRWRFGAGDLSTPRSSAAKCRAAFGDCEGFPVREIIQPDGSILLVPERKEGEG